MNYECNLGTYLCIADRNIYYWPYFILVKHQEYALNQKQVETELTKTSILQTKKTNP
jgi:hypothetical protein